MTTDIEIAPHQIIIVPLILVRALWKYFALFDKNLTRKCLHLYGERKQNPDKVKLLAYVITHV